MSPSSTFPVMREDKAIQDVAIWIIYGEDLTPLRWGYGQKWAASFSRRRIFRMVTLRLLYKKAHSKLKPIIIFLVVNKDLGRNIRLYLVLLSNSLSFLVIYSVS